MADSIHTAPGWRIIDEDFYTCVRPADCPPDPVFERIVHEFDPGAIFMWRKQRYLPPGATQAVTVTHQAVGRYNPSPNRDYPLFHVEMPMHAKHARPNELVFVWERFDTCLMQEGGPGAYMPWDGSIVNWLRSDYNVVKSSRDILKIIATRRAAVLRKKQNERIEFEREWAEFNRWMQKMLDRPGDTAEAYRQYEVMRKSKRGTKPYVFQGA